jgi:AbiV family abortive infection protein
MKKDGVSKYKLDRIATESLRNSLRLHFDSILLFNNKSYPSSFQLAVLALEELSKAKWVEHYIDASESNTGYPNKEFEQEWFKLLYLHPAKQWNFIAREIFEYSPKFVTFVENRKLEEKKQNAIYVGLTRSKGKVDASSRVSTPLRIKKKDAAQIISLLNAEFLRICQIIEEYDFYFIGSSNMDEVFDYVVFKKLFEWPHKSGLKNSGWWKRNRNRN